jgi:hypothetical protein
MRPTSLPRRALFTVAVMSATLRPAAAANAGLTLNHHRTGRAGWSQSKKPLAVVSAVLIALLAPAGASATPATIASYDVSVTPASGFGGWGHAYTGAITDTGRSITGSTGCPCPIVSETGGSGALYDGVISTDIGSTHLFSYGVDTSGEALDPVITLHLAETTPVGRISLYGGYIGGNIYPGAIVSATVEIEGQSVTLTTDGGGDPTLDVLDLTGTGLELIATDTIVIRDVRSEVFGFPLDQFALAELVLDSTVVTDVEPPAITAPAEVVVDATGPEGNVATYEVTATDERDGAVPVNCTPPSGSVFSVGTTQAVCIATDAAGNAAAARFFVIVRGAGEQLNALRAAVAGLDAGARVVRALHGILGEARDALEKGKAKQAARRLGEFIAAVEGYRTEDDLSADQADALFASAQAIRGLL